MIFYRTRSIFIRTPKTASSSILMALFGIDEGSWEPNYMLHEEIKRHLPPDIKNKWKHDPHHYPLDILHECLPKDQRFLVKRFFKYAFVRNPFDKLVSMYRYRVSRSGGEKYNLKEFLLKTKTSTDVWDWSQVDLTSGCDFIGKYENLQKDFDTICEKIGIPQQELPHTNSQERKHYTEYYDDETRSIVAEKYAKDIEYFGYKFGE